MPFTGSQFRDKYEIEPRTWYRNLHSVTEYIYFTRLIPGILVQIIFYKQLTVSYSSCNTVESQTNHSYKHTQHTEHLIGIIVHTDM